MTTLDEALPSEAIDAALAACELADPDNGNSGAPAIATEPSEPVPNIQILVEEIVAFTRSRRTCGASLSMEPITA